MNASKFIILMGKGSYRDQTRWMLSLQLSLQQMQDSLFGARTPPNKSPVLSHRFCYLKSEPTDWMQALGDYLGELTNELDDDNYITTFVSGGPKNYTYQTRNAKTTCKVRGFTLNYRGSQKLNFATMCEHVCSSNQQPIFLVNQHFIKRDAKTKTIQTVNLKKKYKLVYDKRVVHGFRTLPYGFQ